MPATARLTLVPHEAKPELEAEPGGRRGREVVSLPGHDDTQRLLRSLHALKLEPATPQLELERIRWQLAIAVRSHLTNDGGQAA